MSRRVSYSREMRADAKARGKGLFTIDIETAEGGGMSAQGPCSVAMIEFLVGLVANVGRPGQLAELLEAAVKAEEVTV